MQWFGLYMVGISFFLFVFMFILDKICNREEKKTILFKTPLYYCVRRKEWYDSNISIGCIGLPLICFVFFIMICFNYEFLTIPENYEEPIAQITSVVLTFFAVVVSVIVFSVTLGPKEYYLLGTRKSVNRQFGIHIVFWSSCIFAFWLVVCLSVLFQINELSYWFFPVLTLFYICCFAIMVGGLYGLVIIGILTLGKSEMELYSLDKLYTIFGNNEPLRTVNKTNKAISVNLGYLMWKYFKTKYVKKGMLCDITKIEFFQQVEKGSKWEKKAIVILIRFLAGCVIASTLCAVMLKDYRSIKITLLGFGIVICVLLGKTTARCIGKYVLLVIFDNNGFVMSRNNKEEIFVGEYPLVSNRASRKYIRSICNIMALYCIVCSSLKEKKGEKVAQSLIEMVECFSHEDKKYEGYSKALFYLPVFVGGYYYYSSYPGKPFPKELIELFDSFELTNKQKESYYIIINSFIAYGGRFRQTFKKGEERKEIKKEYLNDYIKHNGYSKLFKGLKRYNVD